MDYRKFSESDLKWIKRFQKVMKDAPGELFLFAGAGSLIVYSEQRMDGLGGTGVN